MKAPQSNWETWTCKDGREISVGDMSEAHLRNTLNLILRKQRERSEEKIASTFSEFVRQELQDLKIKPWENE